MMHTHLQDLVGVCQHNLVWVRGQVLCWHDPLHSPKAAHKVDVHDPLHAEVHKVAADPPLLALVCVLGDEDVTGARLRGKIRFHMYFFIAALRSACRCVQRCLVTSRAVIAEMSRDYTCELVSQTPLGVKGITTQLHDSLPVGDLLSGFGTT